MAVLEAQGSVLTNKYAEGYPGKRWYGGCEHVDIVESLAIERAKTIFGAEHVNVQAHSGSQANMAVYFAAVNPGDTVLAMDLAAGGHLTHGHPHNFSGRFFKMVGYGVDKKTEALDYDVIAELAKLHKPKMILAGASAYPRTIDFKKFRQIADMVGAYLFVDMAWWQRACIHRRCLMRSLLLRLRIKLYAARVAGLFFVEKSLLRKLIARFFPEFRAGH